MYVQVTHGSKMGGDFLLEVPKGAALHSGTFAIPFDPKADDHDIVGELSIAVSEEVNGEPRGNGDYEEWKRNFFTEVHVLEIEQDQTQYEANKSLLVVKCIWWVDPTSGAMPAVVTTRNIFVIGENGQTVAKVR